MMPTKIAVRSGRRVPSCAKPEDPSMKPILSIAAVIFALAADASFAQEPAQAPPPPPDNTTAAPETTPPERQAAPSDQDRPRYDWRRGHMRGHPPLPPHQRPRVFASRTATSESISSAPMTSRQKFAPTCPCRRWTDWKRRHHPEMMMTDRASFSRVLGPWSFLIVVSRSVFAEFVTGLQWND